MVSVADPASKIFRTDMTWIDVVVDFRTFDGVEHCARRYWRGEERTPNGVTMEVLVEGDLVVVDRITAIPNGTP